MERNVMEAVQIAKGVLAERDARIADLEARLAVATHWQGNLATIIRLRGVVDAAIGWVADDESGDPRSADQGSARLHNAVRAYQAEEKKLASMRTQQPSFSFTSPPPLWCTKCKTGVAAGRIQPGYRECRCGGSVHEIFDTWVRRPTPVKLCPTCDGKRTIGVWDGKGGFEYTRCETCKEEGVLSGPEWGVCQHCKKQLSFAHNCCTSCADERGP